MVSVIVGNQGVFVNYQVVENRPSTALRLSCVIPRRAGQDGKPPLPNPLPQGEREPVFFILVY